MQVKASPPSLALIGYGLFCLADVDARTTVAEWFDSTWLAAWH